MKNLIKTILPLLAAVFSCFSVEAQLTLNTYSGESEISAPNYVILAPGFHATGTVRIFTTGTSYKDCFALSAAPSSAQNYILTRTFKQPGVNNTNINTARNACDENQVIQYFDGLGRPIQTVSVQASPNGKDLVQPFAYDAFGREDKKYLPYAAQGGSNGSYRSAAISEQLGFYTTSGTTSGEQMTNGIVRIPTPFAETLFEASPLNRVLQQGSPGDDWQISAGHTQRIDYGTNAENEVRLWTLNSTNNGASATTYAAGKLYKTISKDENWKAADGKKGTTEEFKDFEGRVVLKRIWETDSKSLDTYYVYDDLGNLRYVLPPAVNKNGKLTSPLTSFTETDAAFLSYIYGYHYDGRKRLTEKKIPGKGWEFMVYNKIDQVVLTQDANQRSKSPKEWFYSKYDAFGRVVTTGLYTDGSSRTVLQDTLNNQAQQIANGGTTKSLWETRNGADYDGKSFPQTGGVILTISYYDDYDFTGNTFGQPTGTQAPKERTKGLQTGSKVKVLGTTTMLLSVNYYDLEGRVVQTKATNHLGGTDVVDNRWNFDGSLKASTRTHIAKDVSTTIATRYEYDHVGRKIATFENINDKGEITLSHLSYNEVGQLMKKGLYNDKQSTQYTYNERGWLKGTTSNQFSMQLGYNTGTSPQYNGNIASQDWGAGASLPNVYSYGYDRLNRLTSAASTGINMSETLTYDVMGNINTMSRDGGIAGTYHYTGNKLDNITNGPLATGTYAYDDNVNATTDGRNGMALTYNILNLPQTVTKAGVSLAYTYDATGRKLTKSANGALRQYVDGIEYDGNTIDIIHTEEGIARKSGNGYIYNYNLTDHLGNVRVTFYENSATQAMEVLQRDDYYAFGLRKIGSPNSNTNKYLYNGKELQDELGQYDYGARFYDPVIGRWNVIDPKAELGRRWSPYNYTFDNPIKFTDPDGMWPDPIFSSFFYSAYAVVSVKVQSIVNRIGKTALKMEKPQKSRTGKDVVSMELGPGFKKRGVGAQATVKVAANSEKGMTLTGGTSVQAGGAYNSELSATLYNDSKGKMKVDFNREANVLPEKPKDELSFDVGPASVNVNPKETTNVLKDALDGFKKFIKATIDDGKKKEYSQRN